MLASVVAWVSCQTPDEPRHRIDYFGNNTFRWGAYEGLDLVSHSPDQQPQIRTDGTFVQTSGLQLALSKDKEVLPEFYEALPGDLVTVDFSTFQDDGRITLTRQHRGLAYVKEFLEARSDGLESVGYESLPIPERSRDEILRYGDLYFQQAPGADLEEAKTLFFHAACHYPKLAVQYLRRLESRAEVERDAVVAIESVNYRDRLEILEELQAEAEAVAE